MPAPQRYIKEELKAIDRDLSVEWDDRIKRFMIYHKDKYHRKYPVLKVQYKDGSYKPLDRRTIDSLKVSNKLRCKHPQDILYEIDRENAFIEDRKKKNLSNDIEAITKDNWRQMMGVPVIKTGGLN